VPAERHVIAPFISFLLLYDAFIQGVPSPFIKVHQNFAQIGNFCFEEGGQSKAARAKTIEYRYKHFTPSRPRIWRRFQKSNKKL